jgi:rfaE bifunctional protein nucleotidyltransferase chain/domain
LKEKIYQLQALKTMVKDWQSQGQKVVFTNGCFDILHLGHVDYLEKSKSLGDKLVVGVNSDTSVKRLKGLDRPVNNENSRSRIIASLMFVDAAIIFAEDTPLELITALKPDILVKGKDYNISNIVGADIVLANGGKVSTVELVDGYATSSIINKIKTTKQ